MKRLTTTLALLSLSAILYAASSSDLQSRQYASYQDTGFESSLTIVLASSNTVATVTLPDDAKGFKLYPRSTSIRFSVNQSTVTVSSTSYNTSFASSDLGAGGIAKNDQWETRLLPYGKGRQLMLRPDSSSVTVDLEAF